EQAGAGGAGRGVVDDLAVVADEGAAVRDPAAPREGIGGRVVADHALVDRDRAAGAASHAVAAGNAAAARRGVVIDCAAVEGHARGDTEDAAAAAARLR